MLSICIPVYNTLIVSLVDTLHRQCTDCAIPFEIICLDDASSTFLTENKQVASLPFVRYRELTHNTGRAVIRNMLALEARYEYILYLDADVSIEKADFISLYRACIQQAQPVVVGGIAYHPKDAPKEKRLHYTYGRCRESKTAALRNKNPYSSFLTGNLLVQKKLVDEIKFLASLKDYGHEDTLFCIELKKRAIPLIHIDNPVLHEGLETNEAFVNKHLTAVRNLSLLIKQGYSLKGVSLYDGYCLLRKYRLVGCYSFLFRLLRESIYKALISGGTNRLSLFDALRLHELCVRLKKD